MTDTSDYSQPKRSDFWRRVGALLIDSIIVLLPLQILVMVLYAQTNGAVQGTFGFTTTICYSVSALPEGIKLDPPPPADYDSITDCHTGLLGFDMSRELVISKSTEQGSVTTTVSQTYTLGPDSVPRTAWSMDIPAIIIFLAYLIFMEFKSGSTFGKRAVKIRAVDIADVTRSGLPLRKAIQRNLAMWIGSIPGLLVLALLFFKSLQAAPNFSGVFFFVAIAFIIQLGWTIWIIVSVSQKNDPIYDQLAATAVIRVETKPVSAPTQSAQP